MDVNGFNGVELSEPVDDYVMFDLETTGLDVEKDKVVEIAAIKVMGGVVVSQFQTLVNPGCKIPPEVIELHGITDEQVADAPDLPEAVAMFNQFVHYDALVGQNIINFDLPMLFNNIAAVPGCETDKFAGCLYLDMLTLSRRALPALRSHSMSLLGEFVPCG